MTKFENSWDIHMREGLAHMYIPTFSNLVIIYLLAYEDGTECSETSAYKIQTPGNYPEENIQQCKIIPELWTQHHLNPRWKVHFNPSSGYKELDQR